MKIKSKKKNLNKRKFNFRITKEENLGVIFIIIIFVSALVYSIFLDHTGAISAGPNNPGTLTTSAGTGNINWTSPGNASSSNNVYATASMKRTPASQNTSYYLEATNFGFSIPTSATIFGITAEVERSADTASCIRDLEVRIIKGGVIDATQNKADTTNYWPTADAYKTYGGPADLWGLGWTPVDINAGNFGFAIMAQNQASGNPTCLAQIDHMRATVEYGFASTLEQSAYRWFRNVDYQDVGGPEAAQDTPFVAPQPMVPMRLRALLHVGGAPLSVSGTSLKLQYAGKGAGTCAAPSGIPVVYTDVTNATNISFYDNSIPADGVALIANLNDPSHLGHTIRSQTYEEQNNFTNSQSGIAVGEDGLWDFSLTVNPAAPANTTYCLRIIKSDGTLLNTYTVYPEVTTPLISGFVYDEQDSPANGKNSYEPGIGTKSWAKLIDTGAVIAVDQACIDSGAYSFGNISLTNGNSYDIVIDDNSSTADVTPTSPSSSWAFVWPDISGKINFTYAGSALQDQNVGLAFIGGCTCTGGNGQFTLSPITTDGNFSDWGPVLADPDNNACDGPAGGLTDLDAPVQSTGRDLVRFAYTWNNTYYSAFTERVGSSNNIDKFIYYADTDLDDLMETGEPVVAVRWKGTNRNVQVYLGDYVAIAPGGDPLEDGGGNADGYAMPGTITNLPAPGSPDYSGSWGDIDGYKMEWRVTWADLGVAPGSPIQWHVASTNKEPSSALLPANIDDNLGGCGGCTGSSQYGDLNFTPNNNYTINAGDTVYGYHTITNTGNGPDIFDITSYVTTSFVTGADPTIANYYFDDGAIPGAYDAGDTAMVDTDADGIIDTGTIAASGTVDFFVEMSTSAPIDPADTAVVTTNASSSVEVSCGLDPFVAKQATDQLTISAGAGAPNLSTSTKTDNDADNTVSPGQSITYTITVINTGSTTGTGIDIDDTLDSDLENLAVISLTNCGGAYTDNSTTSPPVINIDDVSVATSTNCVIIFSADVKAGAANGATIPNSATISAANEGGSGGSPSSDILTVSTGPGPGPSAPGTGGSILIFPFNYSVEIQDGAACTEVREVLLTLRGENTADYKVSNDKDLAGAEWQPFSNPLIINWLLTAGDGIKTVYARFRSGSGDISNIASDIIELDSSGCGEEIPPQPPPPGAACVIDCDEITYDLYIVNPNGTERHMGTGYTNVKEISDGRTVVYFEDKGLDFDYDDIVIKVDKRDCQNITFEAIFFEAIWHHQIKLKLFYKGLPKEDITLWRDSHLAMNNPISFNVYDYQEDICLDIVKGEFCNLDCGLVGFDLFIRNPDGTERHMGSRYVKVEEIENNLYSVGFEDKGEDFDYNDIIIEVDKRNCPQISYKPIYFEANWQHEIWVRLLYEGIAKQDILLWPNSHRSIDGAKTINVNAFPNMCKDFDILEETKEVVSDIINKITETVEEIISPAEPPEETTEDIVEEVEMATTTEEMVKVIKGFSLYARRFFAEKLPLIKNSPEKPVEPEEEITSNCRSRIEEYLYESDKNISVKNFNLLLNCLVTFRVQDINYFALPRWNR